MNESVYLIKDENGKNIMRTNDKKKRDDIFLKMKDEKRKVLKEEKVYIRE